MTIWKEFHEFWLKSKIPVHIIRYEDICQKPEPTMTELIKYILNVETLEGTKVEKYIKIACTKPSPQVYKPRKGVVHGNKEKFRPMALDFMFNYANELLCKFDYAHLLLADGTAAAENYKQDTSIMNIAQLNAKALKESIYNYYESEDVTSIMINYPALLLRKKSELYPDGRTSYRFKRMLRNKVEIVGKSAFDAPPKMSELD